MALAFAPHDSERAGTPIVGGPFPIAPELSPFQNQNSSPAAALGGRRDEVGSPPKPLQAFPGIPPLPCPAKPAPRTDPRTRPLALTLTSRSGWRLHPILGFARSLAHGAGAGRPGPLGIPEGSIGRGTLAGRTGEPPSSFSSEARRCPAPRLHRPAARRRSSWFSASGLSPVPASLRCPPPPASPPLPSPLPGSLHAPPGRPPQGSRALAALTP